uniref:Cadherin domain-containing protein n=1 Tax=Romanomermis culicivorax TaxID=13658 RepID=A0A915I0R7_ROMCU
MGGLDLTSILNLVGSPDFGLLYNGSVVVKRPLDREVTDFYNLSLKTLNIDQHYCQIDVKVTILDVNDQVPVIHNQQPEFSLLENSPGPFPVLLTQIRAIDFDLGNNGSIGFTIKRDKADSVSKFLIHKESGALLCTEPLDREEVEKYEFTIVASDKGDKKSLFSENRFTLNVLDVRDSPPYFTHKSYSAEIYENATVGRHILTVEALSKDS